MREFHSFAAFAAHLAGLAVAHAEAEHHSLERVGALLEAKAKDKIGDYQPQAGPFVAWAELADSTKADRLHQGYTENDPLLRSGDMRDSIGHRVHLPEVYVGSDDPIAEYQELGTAKIPPRSFLGSTAVENADKVIEIVGADTMLALTGEQVFLGMIPIKP